MFGPSPSPLRAENPIGGCRLRQLRKAILYSTDSKAPRMRAPSEPARRENRGHDLDMSVAHSRNVAVCFKKSASGDRWICGWSLFVLSCSPSQLVRLDPVRDDRTRCRDCRCLQNPRIDTAYRWPVRKPSRESLRVLHRAFEDNSPLRDRVSACAPPPVEIAQRGRR